MKTKKEIELKILEMDKEIKNDPHESEAYGFRNALYWVLESS